MVSLTVTHAGGTRSVESYRVTRYPRSWAATPEAVPEAYSRHGMRVWGDEREDPVALEVTAHVVAATLAGAYALAYQVVRECETATVVGTHLGVRAVNGLLGYTVRPDGAAEVEVQLAFAPRGSA